MKKILLIALSLNVLGTYAQNIVNTGRGFDHAILEEFSGIRCATCPDGSSELNNVASNFPSKLHIIQYHPYNSSYTAPYTNSLGGRDYRRTFANAFYDDNFAGGAGVYMPGAFINRNEYSGTLTQVYQNWNSRVSTIVNDSVSPVNIGITSTYNSNNQSITVDVEVFYLETVTADNFINVFLTEDNTVTDYQNYNGNNIAPYTYNHTFREHLTTQQWGDPITGIKAQGSLISRQYTFNLSDTISAINISNAHIVAFVSQDTTLKSIHNGISASANGGTNTTGVPGPPINTTSLKEINSAKFTLFPNPSNDITTLYIDNSIKDEITSISIFDLNGKLVENLSYNNQSSIIINTNSSKYNDKGTYLIRIYTTNTVIQKKLVKI